MNVRGLKLGLIETNDCKGLKLQLIETNECKGLKLQLIETNECKGTTINDQPDSGTHLYYWLAV